METKSNLKTGAARRRYVDNLLKGLATEASFSHRFPHIWAQSLDLLCFSHLRWDFVFQRPQHVMTRFAKRRRVYFIEEPVFEEAGAARLAVQKKENQLFVLTPHLAPGLSIAHQHAVLRELIDQFLTGQDSHGYVAWYYTPMALGFTRHLRPHSVVYDCMDELSAFKGAPPSLLDHEAELLRRADLVFTGGQSLYEAKRDRHANIHPFPSSIDRAHFEKARHLTKEPADQQPIPHPRIGFAGVIDERMDIALLDGIAKARPDWHFVMIGPVVKIDLAHLPQRANIHYLGQKSYNELPGYLSGWDAAMLPFAKNESTKFISPTKTPEYLAAGRPVVSTSIRDVVRPYADLNLVEIADRAADFVAGLERAMQRGKEYDERRSRADAFLKGISWDQTWERMNNLISEVIVRKVNRRRALPVRSQSTEEERRRIISLLEGRLERFHDRRQAEHQA